MVFQGRERVWRKSGTGPGGRPRFLAAGEHGINLKVCRRNCEATSSKLCVRHRVGCPEAPINSHWQKTAPPSKLAAPKPTFCFDVQDPRDGPGCRPQARKMPCKLHPIISTRGQKIPAAPSPPYLPFCSIGETDLVPRAIGPGRPWLLGILSFVGPTLLRHTRRTDRPTKAGKKKFWWHKHGREKEGLKGKMARKHRGEKKKEEKKAEAAKRRSN